MNTTSRPAVSILMPSFNHASYIGEAIASIGLAEHPEVELIVADGGSDDGTAAILAEAAARHPGQVRWRSAPDAGPADAVNRALADSRGPWIGWLNADDRYAEGAVTRATQHFASHPDCVMVYGHGRHIDADGSPIGDYPSSLPADWLARASDGCGICQPTAFIQRAVFVQLGGLDASLRAAFDFDLWLRLWQAHPGRIGFIDRLQADSRLHPGGITLRERRTVALEALRVLRRHLGIAPAHWLHTWVHERIAAHPWVPEPTPLAIALQDALMEATPDLDAAAASEVADRIARHAAIRVATPCVAVDLTEDGWALARLQVRWQQPAAGEAPLREVRLDAEHAHPTGRPMRIRILASNGSVQEQTVAANGPFTVVLPVVDLRPHARGACIIDCLDPFVPSEVELASNDRRRLGFRVTSIG